MPSQSCTLSQKWWSLVLDGLVTPSIGIPTKRMYSVVHYLSNKHPQMSVRQTELELQPVLPEIWICPYKYGFLTPYGINVRNFKKYGFFPFSYGFFIFSSIFTIFLSNFLWFLRTSQFYSEWKICGAIVSFQW